MQSSLNVVSNGENQDGFLCFYAKLASKDNEAARRRLRRRIWWYVEEADDDANEVSRRRRLGMEV